MAGCCETATAIGFYNSLASICTLLASSLAGLLWFTLGPGVMFLVSGIGVFGVGCYLVIVAWQRNQA